MLKRTLGMASLCVALTFTFGLACADSSSIRGADRNNTSQDALLYHGPDSLEERVAGADVIVRANLRSVTSGIERWQPDSQDSPTYVGTIEHRFAVLEYLKGTGDNEVVGVVWGDEPGGNLTQDEATQAGADLLTQRKATWDGREAIIFLEDDFESLIDFPQDGRYVLGSIDLDIGYLGDYYTIASLNEKQWMPAVAGARGGNSRSSSANSQRFLLDVPASGRGGGASAASGQSEDQTITLGALRKAIANIEREISDGGGSSAYRECVYHKYKEAARVAWIKEARGGNYFHVVHEQDMLSGLPRGTHVYSFIVSQQLLVEDHGWTEPSPPFSIVELLGSDGVHFSPRWPAQVFTNRPLPAGEYRFFYNAVFNELIPCDGKPQEDKETNEVVVTVTAPAGTVHEAFFDPVSSGDAVGYFGTGDALKPTSFSIGDANTTIQSLKWEDSAVTMGLSPYNALTERILDFITGDGTTALSLEVTAATGDGTAGTLTWAVGTQPWSSGDELMLRITEPWFGVKVALSPREEGSRTLTDITISWADPQTCSDGYFVALYRGDTVVRRLGYPDATTTSISNSTGMQWDSIPSRTSTARVNCMDSGWRLVGEVPLTSGLP